MRRPQLVVLAVLCVALVAPSFIGAGTPGPGVKSPEVTTTKWINNKGPVSWDRLAGKLILVEKWATW